MLDLISWRTGYKFVYYGIINTGPTQKKKHTEFFKILKFGVYQAAGDTAVQKLQNLKGNDIQYNPYNNIINFLSKFFL